MITITIDKSDPDNAAAFRNCKVGDMYDIEGAKITSDDGSSITLEADSADKTDAGDVGEGESGAPGGEENSPEYPGRSSNPAIAILAMPKGRK